MSSTSGFSSAGQEIGISKPKNGYIRADGAMETLVKDSRLCNANRFRRKYKFVKGDKSCITSDGRSFRTLKEDKCYDRIWVGVHGKESICMVTLKEDVDTTRVAPYHQNYCLNHQTMRSYAEAIISEVECIPYDDEFRKRFDYIVKKPFGVVSVIPSTVHEGSSHEQGSSVEYDQEKAIEFLKDKMKSDLTFTFDETVQTAISAFQHLCRKELKVEDIWVSTAWNIDSYTDHMRLPERKEYLDIISGVSSSEGRPPKVHLSYPSFPSGTPNGSLSLILDSALYLVAEDAPPLTMTTTTTTKTASICFPRRKALLMGLVVFSFTRRVPNAAWLQLQFPYSITIRDSLLGPLAYAFVG